MGNAKRLRKKYHTPRHPWQKTRLDEERELAKEYGTKNKKEIWKVKTKLDIFRIQAKRAGKARTTQEQKEAEEVLTRARKYGLIGAQDGPGALLGLKTKDLMERRLQTLLFRKGLARTVKQARQMIIHRHVAVGHKVITSPNYLVTVADENNIQYKETSPFTDDEHPERKKDEVQEAAPVTSDAEAEESTEAQEEKDASTTEESKDEKVEAAKGAEE